MNRVQNIGATAGLLCLFSPAGHAQQTAPPPVSPGTPDYASRILTPPAPPTPRINGASVYGQRPGSPFLYTIPATGDRPMTFRAQGLPQGLSLDPQTGIIRGVVPTAGEFTVRLTARNAHGSSSKNWRIVIGDKIALTPPLGWNSWNSWAGSVDQEKVLRSARVLVSSGLINHGWSYVNIDDTWQGERTGPDHALQPNAKFPDMKGLCDQLHAMGLKAGIYSTPWITSYASYPGGSSDTPEGSWTRALANNQNHRVGPNHFAAADAKQWATWGFDYLKYDWNPNDLDTTSEMSQALRQSGRDIALSLSNSAPFEHAADWTRLANAWRTTGDIADSWGRPHTSWQQGMGQIAFSQDRWQPFSGPGHWNDPDMLVLGTVSLGQRMHYTNLTPDEQYTHITMWSLLSAPMLIGCDMEKLDPFTLSLLTNDEVLAVDQDALGKGPVKISGPAFTVPPYGAVPSDNPGGNAMVYSKTLEDGTQAVGLFNVGPQEMTIAVHFADLKLTGSQPVRDLWRQKDLGAFQDTYSTVVPSHGAVLVKIGTPPVPTITLDGTALGRPFEGLGAVSGGGNTSRLLPDYPDAPRKQILDYLFKPQFGASLSAFKVEVGGDVNSTEGSEPSHKHTRTDEDYTRGFEWWLMEQAKARNPQIALDCLAWGAPGWVGNGNFWSPDMMDYYISWIKGAKKYHNLDIVSVGGKNERGYDKNWYIGFRKALDAAGLTQVKLVASDDWGAPWLNIAKDSLTDPALAKSIDVFAGHVTWSENPAVASPDILATGKPLWDTELHNYKPGFDAEINLINAFNTNYIKTKITKDLTWNLIWSYYPESSYPDVGLLRANTPWSGHYEVLPVVWGFAHINQFVQPGWRFLENGGNGPLPGGGTLTTLEAPRGSDYSLLAETSGATDPQTIRFQTVHGLSAKALHVWKSTAAMQFVHAADIQPVNGAFTLTLDPNAVYSITTTTGQRKGGYPMPPADAPWKLPYHDDYQNYRLNAQALYHYDYEGAFEIARKTVGKGKCLRQNATQSSSGWGGAYLPLTFLGSSDWKNYTVSADAFIETAGAVSLHGRIGTIPGDNKDDPPGYTFRVQDTGAWVLKSFKTVIASGTTSFSANQWHRLRMSFHGSVITAFVDGRLVCTVTDTTFPSGLVGLGTGWNFAQFSDLQISPDAP